jgi:D-alanyl-D-alanine carboxypeptidase
MIRRNSFGYISLTLIIVALLMSVRIQSQTPKSVSSTNQITTKLAELTKSLQAKLDDSRRLARFPGAQVGFVYIDGQTPDGRPHYVSGSVATGVSDLQRNTPLKTSDRLLAGSIGKTFVAALTLLLVQEGTFNLDEKIEKWLGKQSWFTKLPNAKDITLRMLLNHSSGIENHVDNESFQKQMFKSAGRDIKFEELIAYVLNKKPLFPAGAGYNYADTNYILAGMVIEQATGKTLYNLIADKILKPNGLDRTTPSNSVSLPEVSNGYLEGRPVIVNGKFTINPQWEWTGGGFASTAEDLARWANLLYGSEILSPASQDQMFKSTTTGEGAAYGLGVMITRSKWGRSYGHDGEFPGYLSEMRYYVKHKIAISVMVNSDETSRVNAFLSSAVDNFAEVIIEATATRQLSQSDQAKLQKVTEGWLSLIDTGKYDESWNQLSQRLKNRFTKEAWSSVIHTFLDRTGKLKSRKLRSVAYSDPDSEIVAVDFESSFGKVPTGSETVLLELENGEWKIASYTVH